jgi:hypothetical protein
MSSIRHEGYNVRVDGWQGRDAALTKLVDEYANVWTTGTMKNPQLIPFNQSMLWRDTR